MSVFRPRNIPCTVLGCSRWFKNMSGLTQHIGAMHAPPPIQPTLAARSSPQYASSPSEPQVLPASPPSNPSTPSASPLWSPQSSPPCYSPLQFHTPLSTWCASCSPSLHSSPHPCDLPQRTTKMHPVISGALVFHCHYYGNLLWSMTGCPCDSNGNYLPPNTPPPLPPSHQLFCVLLRSESTEMLLATQGKQLWDYSDQRDSNYFWRIWIL